MIRSIFKKRFLRWLVFFVFATGLVFRAGCSSPPLQSPPSLVIDAEEEEEEYVPSQLLLPPPGSNLPVSNFREIWAYVVVGRESFLDNALPITDVAYFGTQVNAFGRLVGIPNFNNIADFSGRKHLVASCGGRALSYFVLLEGRPERDALIHGLLEAARPYDGLQINFEEVPPESGAAYLSFLRELRAGLGDRMLTVALAARTRTLQNDAYDYNRVLPIVDRILVMAYDEHWSTSAPGPIASMGWCERVARYSLDTIGSEKLIMGLPFYGRRWGNITPNMAFIHSGIEDIKLEQNISEIERDNGIPNFRYETPVSMTVYYEDEFSLATRLDMYRRMGVNSVGFWRLGQETLAFWPYIGLE